MKIKNLVTYHPIATAVGSFATLFLLLLIVFMVFTPATKSIVLSTTTSVDNSGLLDYLFQDFYKKSSIRIKVVAVGTGQALENARNGNADFVIVHAKTLEEKFIQEGYGVHRVEWAYNEFWIVGPKNDPANITGLTNATEAFIRIYNSRSLFVSRGDNSGTHVREQEIWNTTHLPVNVTDPNWLTQNKDWYIQSGQGMGSTLILANQKNAYTLTDMGTWLFQKESLSNLKVHVTHDPQLKNIYSAILVNPEIYPHVKFNEAKEFVKWLISEEGQQRVASYRVNGEQLFFPYFDPTKLSPEERNFWGI